MANYATLKAAIQDVVKTNGNNEITGALLQQSLLAIIDAIGFGYQFIGIATPATVPGTPDQRVFYIGSSGTYPNFGPSVVPDGNLGIFYYDSAWHFGTVAFPIGDGSITTSKIANDSVTGQKLAPEIRELISQHPVSVENLDNADFAISDENGHLLVLFMNGHIKTKNFNSQTIFTVEGTKLIIQ